MIMPDVNVLIYAFHANSPHHGRCRPWLESVVRDDAAFGISKLALSAVVRVTTNRKSFADAVSLKEAFAFCNWLLEQPNARLVEPGERHWRIFERLCHETDTTGARVTDAWFAALAIEHGCEWVTFDRDFARFPGLKWSVPASVPSQTFASPSGEV
ncbi:MAG: type II toxin-antitoxin system VapC family toxin [Hyphomicrobium aestuarii]|nr:type II toxin-antitoxin system VapC family toxin [Hyphomicrobium aestuarii]